MITSELTCFIIMPFAIPGVKDVVQEVVKAETGGLAFRADERILVGSVVEEIKSLIAEADFCVADITNGNANVMWETGFAHALGKPLILISQKTEKLPF